MSATDRRNATRLLSKLKQFAGQDMKNVKLARCWREYFTVSFETPDGGGGTMKMTGAYSYGGHYVGNTQFAHRVLARRGIMPELSDDQHSVCSIGRSYKDGKWYGWSHRAIYGFKKGNTIKEGDLAEAHLPVGFQAQNEDEKREMAVAFARSVS